jgi:hypothetical protein
VPSGGPSAHVGPSLLETLWEELDSIVERLMTGCEAADGRDPGRAEGVAYAIAVITNPYHPSIPAVREECVRRWNSAQATTE